VRRSSRRRPAGNSQVPTLQAATVLSRADELFVWWLGPDRQVWEFIAPAITTVASIWLAGEPVAWRRAVWPQDVNGVAVAPLDLSAGHVLELCTHRPAAVTARYACVIDIASDAIVTVVISSCERALLASKIVATAWCEAHINDAWEHLGRPS
jgi:hypothetical protein